MGIVVHKAPPLYRQIEQEFQSEVGGAGDATMATRPFRHPSRPIPGDEVVAETMHTHSRRREIPARHGATPEG